MQSEFQTLIRVLNVLLGAWAVYAAYNAAHYVESLSFQTVLILLFILMELLQGVLLIFAPRPKIALRDLSNVVIVFALLYSTIQAGVNVVKTPLYSPFGTTLLLAGLILTILSTLQLGRNFGVFAEVRGHTKRGLYRYMRHPMYTGYGLQYVGLMFQTNDRNSIVLLGIAIALQAARAWQEDRALQQYVEGSYSSSDLPK